MAGIEEDEKSRILVNFPFAVGTLPVRYLGLPLMSQAMRRPDHLPLVERIRNKICSWTCRFLSYAGRLQLIQSVLVSIVNFWASVFRLPSKCVKEIEQLCASFLWTDPVLKSTGAKVNWRDICKLKIEGGLGVRAVKEVNTVYGLKLIWRMLVGDSLWGKLIKMYLLKKRSFWAVKSNSQWGSWMWRKMVKMREIAKEFYKMKIGNGRQISFWYDRWLDKGGMVDILGERGFIDLGIRKEATLAEAVLNMCRRRRHRSDTLQEIEGVMDDVRKNIHCGREDVGCWKWRSGFKSSFSTNETWMMIRESNMKWDWARGVWFSKATPKYAFITWLAMRGRLSTMDRVMKWSQAVDAVCVLCKSAIETHNHLFFECPYASQLWESLAKGILQYSYSVNWSSLVRIVSGGRFDRIGMFCIRYAFQAAIYALWRERNRIRHGEIPLPISILQKLTDKEIRNKLSLMNNRRRRGKRMEEKRARKRLVLVPVPAQGHISPMMQLANTLHLKGFSITVAQTKFNYFNPPDDSIDFQFVTIPESLPESDFKNLGPIRFLHKLNKECQVSFKDCLGQLLVQQSNEIACVIYDDFMYFAEAAAKEFNLPNVIFSTTSATAFACRSVFEKLYAENALVPFDDDPKEEQNELVPEFHPLRYKDFLVSRWASLGSIVELYRNIVDKRTASSVIINMTSCLENTSLLWLQQRLEIPVYPIGPLHMVASAPTSLLEESKSCIEWLNKRKQNSVIFVSLGSLALMEVNEVMETSLGSDSSNQHFLWVIRPRSIRGSEWIESLPEEFSQMDIAEGSTCSSCYWRVLEPLWMELDVILIEPDDNTNVVKPIWSTEDKSKNSTDMVKSGWSTEDELENNTCMVKSRWSGEEHRNNLDSEEKLEDEDALIIPEVPMTSARSKKFKEAISGMLRSVWELEERHGQSHIHDTLTTVTLTTIQESVGRRSN